MRLYNNAYNNQVKRNWDSSPFYIPGLAPGIKLHPFQNAMVRRLHTESGLAAWVVGAGKTELGITAAMEGDRLGRHRLTAIVTPASLVNQWRDRIYRTYPEAQGAGRRRRPARPQGRPGDIHRARRLGRLPAGRHPVRVLRVPGRCRPTRPARRSDEEIDKLTRYAQEAAAQGDRYTAKTLQGQIARTGGAVLGGGPGLPAARPGSPTPASTRSSSTNGTTSGASRATRNNRALAIIKGSDRANHMLAVFDYLRKHHPEGLLPGAERHPAGAVHRRRVGRHALLRPRAPEGTRARRVRRVPDHLRAHRGRAASRPPPAAACTCASGRRTGSTCPRCAAPCGTRSPTWSAAPTWD